jgi:HD-like signal output (HDOD) protein
MNDSSSLAPVVQSPATTETIAFDVAKMVQRAKAKLGDGALLSDVATQAVEIASRPEAVIRDLTEVIERDPGLGMQIIRIANSALYSPDRPIEALERAIMMLGLRECQSVILASGISRMMRSVPLEEDWLRSVLCDNAFMCGVICRRLNQYLNLKLHGAEFAAALLHDIGYIVVGTVQPDWLARAEALNMGESRDIIANERTEWGTDHAELGAAFASVVELPAKLVDVVRHHHDFAHADDPLLTALVSFGDEITNHLQRGLELNEFDFESQASLRFLADTAHLRREQVHPTQLVQCLSQVSQDSEQLSKAFL